MVPVHRSLRLIGDLYPFLAARLLCLSISLLFPSCEALCRSPCRYSRRLRPLASGFPVLGRHAVSESGPASPPLHLSRVFLLGLSLQSGIPSGNGYAPAATHRVHTGTLTTRQTVGHSTGMHIYAVSGARGSVGIRDADHVGEQQSLQPLKSPTATPGGRLRDCRRRVPSASRPAPHGPSSCSRRRHPDTARCTL